MPQNAKEKREKRNVHHFHIDEGTVFNVHLIKTKLLPDIPIRNTSIIRACVEFMGQEIARKGINSIDVETCNVRPDNGIDGNRVRFFYNDTGGFSMGAVKDTHVAPVMPDLDSAVFNLNDENNMYEDKAYIVNLNGECVKNIKKFQEMYPKAGNMHAGIAALISKGIRATIHEYENDKRPVVDAANAVIVGNAPTRTMQDIQVAFPPPANLIPPSDDVDPLAGLVPVK